MAYIRLYYGVEADLFVFCIPVSQPIHYTNRLFCSLFQWCLCLCNKPTLDRLDVWFRHCRRSQHICCEGALHAPALELLLFMISCMFVEVLCVFHSL